MATISVVLLLALALLLNNVILLDSNSEEKQRFKIAIVGDPEDAYLNLGIAAVETFDSSRYTIEIKQLDEESAKTALRKNEISAYVVMPQNFVKSALRGDLQPLDYVTTTGASELSAIFKNELTTIIASVLEESQKGVYGLGNALRKNGHYRSASKHMNDISLQYFDFILERNNIYRVTELGISDNLSLPEYLLCGISVLFLLLSGIPYAPIFIRNDLSLNKKLITQGYGNTKQILCEYASYLLANILLVLLLFLITAFAGSFIGGAVSEFIPSFSGLLGTVSRVLPAIIALTSLSFLFFELSGNIVNGILVYFFSTLALCYISGCLYPIYTFPQIIQDISVFLPTGIARSYLASCITKTWSFDLLWLCLYSAAFISIAVLIRRYKTTGRYDG